MKKRLSEGRKQLLKNPEMRKRCTSHRRSSIYKSEKEVIDMYVKGNKTKKQIQQYFGLKSYKPITVILKENNIDLGKRRSFAYKKKDEILDMYLNQKKSMIEIKKYLGLKTYSSITKILKENGIKIKPKGHNQVLWTKDMDLFLKQWYWRGEKDILLNAFGMTWSSIVHRAIRLKIRRDLHFFRTRGTVQFNNTDNPAWRPEVRKKISENNKKYIKEHPDQFAFFMVRRNEMSSLERSVEKILKRNNILYKWNIPIFTGERYRYPDFFIESNKLVIEADGLYWHKNRGKRIKRDRELVGVGCNLLHFHENTIINNIPKVERCILAKLNELNLSA